MKKIFLGTGKFSVAFLIVAFSLFSATSCHNPNNYIIPATPTGTFYFRLYNYIDTSNASSNGYFFDSLGRHISVQAPQLFISGIVLKNTAGGSVSISDAHILTGLDSADYFIGSAPPGTYNSISFFVGLDAATNVVDPSLFIPTGYVAAASMALNSTQGYMAMKINGSYDTTTTHTHTGSGMNPINFSFSVPNGLTNGTLITMPTRGTGQYAAYPTYVMATGGTQYIDLAIDYGKLLSAINLKTQTFTDGDTVRIGIADTLALQAPVMFRYLN